MPAVMNAANEIAVKNFLNEKIGFTDIAKVIKQVMGLHKKYIKISPSIDEIIDADKWARVLTLEAIKKLKKDSDGYF